MVSLDIKHFLQKRSHQKKYSNLSYFPLELFGLKIINCIFALGY